MNKNNTTLVQLHMHTAETSACGRSSAAEMVRACKDAGFDLVAITDHFFNANIGCPRTWPWKERVDYLFRGYYAALREGEKIGVEVLRGWETFTNGPELLTYGLDERFLLENPDIAEVDYYEYIRRVNDAGGKIIHAHPYRKAPYIPDFKPDPASVEAYEVFNAGNRPEDNTPALEEALRCGLLMTAGSDSHHVTTAATGGMLFTIPVHSIEDIFSALRAGDGRIIEQL